MELMTAQMLWSNHDHRRLPLSETVLRTEICERYTIKEVYFNGDATADGVTRVYARLYTPSCIPTGASVVLMNDIDAPFDTTYINLLTDYGFTVLALDYGGQRQEGKFTIYPESLESANYLSEKSDFNAYPENPKTSCWFVYATVMLRGYYYLESQPGLDKSRICFFGVRRGAFQVYKAAFAEPNAACAIALFNSDYLPNLDLTSDSAMLYKSCIANTTYAPFIKVPLYIIESSNNNEDSLFHVNSLYLATADNCSYYIAEQSDNTLNPAQRKSLLAYMNGLCFSHNAMPEQPTIDAVCEDRSLYYKITTFGEDIASVQLYYTYGFSKGAFRNWFKLPIEKTGDHEYRAKADVYLSKEEASAFVSVKYSSGIVLSSEIVTKTPYLLGVHEGEIIKSRLIYETDMGADDWMITKKSELFGEVYMAEGHNGIEGVTSSINTLTTLKIGDLHTRGGVDNLLQLLVYSKTKQTVTFEATCKEGDGYGTYVHEVHLSSFGEWTKITLAANEFKSENGPMESWANAVKFTATSEDSLLINSMLWI